SAVASLSKVEQMQELELSSLDFYAMLRSVVEQKRQAELRAALRESPLSALPGLEDRSGAEGEPALLSPALASPALEQPSFDSPALQAADFPAVANGKPPAGGPTPRPPIAPPPPHTAQ